MKRCVAKATTSWDECEIDPPLAVLHDVVDYEHCGDTSAWSHGWASCQFNVQRTGQEENNRLEWIKEETKRLAQDPTEDHDEWDNEQRDLLCMYSKKPSD